MRTVLALTFVVAVAFSAAIEKKPVELKNQKPDFLCSICVSLVTEVESLAQGDEKDIKKEVDAFCDSLGPIASICKSVVDGYLDQILDNIGQELPPQQVCANIGLC